MSVTKLKRETDTRWEINEEDEGAVEIEAGEIKEKKKKLTSGLSTGTANSGGTSRFGMKLTSYK